MSEWKEKYSNNYKYQVYVTKIRDRIQDIRSMIWNGYSFSQIAKELDVPNSLLFAFRCDKNYKDVRDAFLMEDLQVENVENALYRKAIGYSVIEEQAIKVKKEYYNKKGKKCCEEKIEVVEVIKQIEPDFNAIRFLLLNRGKGKYHTENRNDDESSMNDLLENAKTILVAVKETAEQNQTNKITNVQELDLQNDND